MLIPSTAAKIKGNPDTTSNLHKSKEQRNIRHYTEETRRSSNIDDVLCIIIKKLSTNFVTIAQTRGYTYILERICLVKVKRLNVKTQKVITLLLQMYTVLTLLLQMYQARTDSATDNNSRQKAFCIWHPLTT